MCPNSFRMQSTVLDHDLTCLYPGSPVPGTFGHSLQSLPVFNDLNQNFCLDHESGHAHYHAYPPPPYTDLPHPQHMQVVGSNLRIL